MNPVIPGVELELYTRREQTASRVLLMMNAHRGGTLTALWVPPMTAPAITLPIATGDYHFTGLPEGEYYIKVQMTDQFDAGGALASLSAFQ